jgi:cardiolipin synthase
MQIRIRDLLSVPNLLSLYRLILGLIFPFLWIEKVDTKILLFLIGTAALSDTLDGNIARIFKKKTDLGKILDPIADKVFINMLFFLLYLNKYISLELFLIIILRDLSILIGAGILFLKYSQEISFSPTYLGKACTVSQLLFLLLYFLHIFIKSLNTSLIFSITQIVIFLTILSGVHYGILFYKSFRKSPVR